MPSSVVEFISTALRRGVECSIADLRSLPELANKRALEVVEELINICEAAELQVNPPITSGEFDDVRVFSARQTDDDFSRALSKALERGESHEIEFKQTFGLNVRRLENDRSARSEDLFQGDIVHEVIKTIVGFLNADGGVLVIGLRDDGSCYGIEHEFRYVGGGGNLDQWELRFNSALDAQIPDYRLILGYVRYGIVDYNGSKVCVVIVRPRSDRLCVCRRTGRDGTDEIVYRRSGNQTLKLQAREIEALVLSRSRRG